MQELFAALQVAGIVALGLLAVLGLMTFRERLRRERERERLAEAAFQATMIAAAEEGQMAQTSLLDEAQQLPEEPVIPVNTHNSLEWVSAPEKPSVDSVMSVLQRANLIETVEGYMDLNGDPHGGVIVLLRNRKRALVVPYYETDAFTNRNLKRFDLLIYTGRDGKGVVINSLETLISEELTRYMKN